MLDEVGLGHGSYQGKGKQAYDTLRDKDQDHYRKEKEMRRTDNWILYAQRDGGCSYTGRLSISPTL